MNAPPSFPSIISSAGTQRYSGPVSIGFLSTYPPTVCRMATFSSALSQALRAKGADVSVVRVADDQPAVGDEVIGELVSGSSSSAAECIDLLNQRDVAIVQHDYDIYGGDGGAELVDIVGGLQVPSIVIARTILKDPTPQQRSIFEALTASAKEVVVMSEAAKQQLRAAYDVDRSKVAVITHGATVPTQPAARRPSRPTILTCGLLGPGKGVERVIDAMSGLKDLPGRPQYLVAGRTHPKVLAAEGEAYREARIEQAKELGVIGSVTFDAGYRSVALLTALMQSSAVIVLPYDSVDQSTSGVLVDAIATGRPVIATAFPHALELLGSGAGIVVAHDDPDAMASALRQVLTQPRLAGSMAAESRRLAPDLAWSVVGSAYLKLAQRLVAERRAAR